MTRDASVADADASSVRRLPAAERLKINEIFYSLQGESTHAGRPCVLVRLTGCQMRCVWCDSEYSFYEGELDATIDEVIEEVRAFGCPLVEVTGGEPLLQPGVHTLMKRLCDDGYEVLLETGGGLDIGAGRSSGRADRRRQVPGERRGADNNLGGRTWTLLESGDELKFVIADDADYEWAKEVVERRRLDRERAGALLRGPRRMAAGTSLPSGCSKTASRCGSRHSCTSCCGAGAETARRVVPDGVARARHPR